MKYVYKNIRVTDPQILISGDNEGVTSIHKCQVANTHGTDATVSLYIERFDEDKTIKIHGTQENGNYNSITDDYVTKADQQLYYQIKDVVVPAGAALVLFTDHVCSHDSSFNFVITTTHTVDVILEYEKIAIKQKASRTTNQY